MLKCTIVSPRQKKIIDGLDGIFLQTTTGEMGILTDHIAIVTQLRDGSLARLKTAAGDEIRVRLGTSSFFRFDKNEGLLLTADFSSDGEALSGPAAPGGAAPQ